MMANGGKTAGQVRLDHFFQTEIGKGMKSAFIFHRIYVIFGYLLLLHFLWPMN